MKTSELIGLALDWAVAYAKLGKSHAFSSSDIKGWAGVNTPSTSWAQGGPIIEREGLCVDLLLDGSWLAASRKQEGCPMYGGPTPLIAAMRAFVASRLGGEVEIPEELI